MKTIITLLALCSFSVLAQPVDINQADAETIAQSLNGIGPKKAEAIVKYRAEHGAFKTMSDLENVSGIGAKTLKLNEKDIVISGAESKQDAKIEESMKKTSKN